MSLENLTKYPSNCPVYSFCWDPATQYFFPGNICKGFGTYGGAWNFLLGACPPTHDEIPITVAISVEHPDITVPPKPQDMSSGPKMHHHDTSLPTQVVPLDDDDQDILATYDY